MSYNLIVHWTQVNFQNGSGMFSAKFPFPFPKQTSRRPVHTHSRVFLLLKFGYLEKMIFIFLCINK